MYVVCTPVHNKSSLSTKYAHNRVQRGNNMYTRTNTRVMILYTRRRRWITISYVHSILMAFIVIIYRDLRCDSARVVHTRRSRALLNKSPRQRQTGGPLFCYLCYSTVGGIFNWANATIPIFPVFIFYR